MAVYRSRRRISPLLILVIVALVVVVVVTFFIAIRPVSAPDTTTAGAQAKALEAANGLDVFIIEYQKEAKGESSGAASAFSRAKAAFESAKAELTTLDAATTNQLATDFATLDQQYAAKAPAEGITTLADSIRQRLLALSNVKRSG